MPRINLSAPTDYKGRNGWGICTGISVWKRPYTNPPTIEIRPINSKGQEASGCHIGIPLEDLESFIELLRRVARE